MSQIRDKISGAEQSEYGHELRRDARFLLKLAKRIDPSHHRLILLELDMLDTLIEDEANIEKILTAMNTQMDAANARADAATAAVTAKDATIADLTKQLADAKANPAVPADVQAAADRLHTVAVDNAGLIEKTTA